LNSLCQNDELFFEIFACAIRIAGPWIPFDWEFTVVVTWFFTITTTTTKSLSMHMTFIYLVQCLEVFEPHIGRHWFESVGCEHVVCWYVQAVDEPNFSEAYANMCKVLSSTMQAQADRKTKDEPEFSFRKLLVSRCQMEFEKSSEVELNREAKLKEIEETTDQVSTYTN
jgi:hypothetical protein